MKRVYALLPVALLLLVPVLLRPRAEVKAAPVAAAETLVIVSAHGDSVRYEYAQAFRKHYREKFGVDIELDFRSLGGSNDIVRYIADRYEAEFRHEFERDPGNGPWTPEIAAAFSNPATLTRSDVSPAAKQARRLFLASSVGIGVDLMAGGGTYEQARNAARGFAVDGGVAERRPELLAPELIPSHFGGDALYDPEGRYYGVVLSTFGICANLDRLRELGAPPVAWRDLGEPRFFNTLALTDPVKSGSANRCFEIILQQCMAEAKTPDEGWEEGFALLRRIFANARSLTDSARKVPLEVAAGNAAAGMAIDTYGLTQEEWSEYQFPGHPRFVYITPKGGTAVSADPIQLLRGAPNPRAAKEFIDFLLSREGQMLHAFKAGEPGGPVRHALRRPPIRRDLYDEKYRPRRSDPDYNPYASGADFVYRPQWTAPYYNLIRNLLKTLCLETHPELQIAWRAILDAGGPEKVPEAWASFTRLPFPYQDAAAQAAALRTDKGRSPVEVAALLRSWSDGARRNYLEAARLAKEGR